MIGVREVLSAFAAHGLDTRPDELGRLAWDADCPSCRHLSDGQWPLRIDHGPGGSVRLRCTGGCAQQAVLAAVGLGWQIPGALPAPVEAVHEAPVGRPKLVLRDVERMLTTDPPQVPWLAPPILAKGSVTLLSGPAKSGKSMFGIALAAAMGRGETVAGIECQQGSALVIDAENGEGEVHRRIRGLRIEPETLTYAGTQGFSLRRDFEWVEDAVSQYRPDLLVLDSFRSLAPGEEENDSGAVEAILELVRSLARRYDCAVLLLHHTGKAGGPRGSSAFTACVDIAFELNRDGNDPKRRVLRNTACRIAAEADPIYFAITTNQDGTAGIDAAAPSGRATSGEGQARRPIKREQTAQRLAQAATEHGPLKWAELCRRIGEDPGSSSTTRARDLAVASGTLRGLGNGVYGPAEQAASQPHPEGVAAGWLAATQDEEAAA